MHARVACRGSQVSERYSLYTADVDAAGVDVAGVAADADFIDISDDDSTNTTDADADSVDEIADDSDGPETDKRVAGTAVAGAVLTDGVDVHALETNPAAARSM